MMPLTERQQRVYDVVRAYIERRHIAPTVREIMAEAGVSSESEVIRFLRRLEEAGYIRRYERVSRGIILTEAQP